jgi:uncharacterized protein YsxB (DUF464 family)
MTQIRYTEHGDRIRISVHGHAQYNPGNDVVCAGISTITCQLINYVGALEENGVVSDTILDEADGHIILCFKVSPGEMEGWHTAWKVISTGYESLASEYPDHVMLEG